MSVIGFDRNEFDKQEHEEEHQDDYSNRFRMAVAIVTAVDVVAAFWFGVGLFCAAAAAAAAAAFMGPPHSPRAPQNPLRIFLFC